MSSVIRVPIAGIALGRGPDTMTTVLGSCLAIMLYDKSIQLGGMIHIMLGYAHGKTDNPSKYADTGIPYLMNQMIKQGASKKHLTGCKITGGSEMYPSQDASLSVSVNNIKAVHILLDLNEIQIISSDCGGSTARRVQFDLSDGKVYVHRPNAPIRIL